MEYQDAVILHPDGTKEIGKIELPNLENGHVYIPTTSDRLSALESAMLAMMEV